MPDKAASHRTDLRFALGSICLIVVLTGLIYGQVGQNEFVDWDDYTYFIHNPHLDGELSLTDLGSAFTEPYFTNWSPLSSISIRLGDAVHGAEPGPVLLLNVLLHGLASILLFMALHRLSGQVVPSAFVGLAFAVHPLHVESVAWASQRKDVLAGVFWLGTLWLYALYTERRTASRYVAVLGASLLALLAKPSAVSLPLTLLLLDFWPLGRLIDRHEIRRAVAEKIPLVLMAGAVSVVAYRTHLFGADHSDLHPFNLRIVNAGASYWAYMVDFIWPLNLSAYYRYPSQEDLLSWPILFSILALGGLTVAAVASYRRRPYLLMGWLWFGITLVPMIGIIQVGGQARADRYMYVPAIGLAIALAWWVQSIADHWPAYRRALGVSGLVAVLLWAAVAHQQVGYWRDTLSLFGRALELDSSNYIAHDKLGVVHWQNGDEALGEEHMRRALEIRPVWGGARLRLALALNGAGRFREARPQFRLAQATGAEAAQVHAGLGVAAQQLGEDRVARAEYRTSLDLEPEEWEIVNNLAWLLATTRAAGLRAPKQAIELAEAASTAEPNHPDYRSTLAAAYAADGRFSLAISTQVEALELLSDEDDPAVTDSFREQLERFRAERPVFWSP